MTPAEASTLVALAYLLVLLLSASQVYPPSIAALTGALLAAWFGIGGGLFTYEEAAAFVDFRLITLIVGVMITVEVISRTGLFRLLGIAMVRALGRDWKKLMASVCVLSAATSLFLSDAAAVLLVAAVSLSASRLLGYDPVPFAIASAIMVNLGGTGTLIGSVSNMVIGVTAGLSFNEFAFLVLPCELILWGITTAVLIYFFRGRFPETPPAVVADADEGGIVIERPKLLTSAALLALMVGLFVASDAIGLPPEGVAASLAVVALAVSGADPGDVLKRIDWETVFFVAGFLFVVKGLERSGALARFSELITMAGAGEPTLTAVVVLVLSGVLSAFFANVAVALSMAPAVEILGVPDTRPVWAALVLGTNLGGATIPYASIVMVMVMNALKQEGLRADLGEALRAGAVTSAAQLLASAAYILVRFGVAG